MLRPFNFFLLKETMFEIEYMLYIEDYGRGPWCRG